MIINGDPAGNVGFWSKHLLRADTNEKVEVLEISGLTASDLPGALREMQAVASGSRSHGNFMYQININPLAHERLTPDQWIELVDIVEHNLGLEGHQRVVVIHNKEGREHAHVIWNRVDIHTMKVADMGGNYRIHEQTSRQLERHFGLTPMKELTPEKRERPIEFWERCAAERHGINIKDMVKELTSLWHSADSGAAFQSAVDERGYILAKGDRRDFCIIDRAGVPHNLARRLDGVDTAGVRAKMSDLDRDSLPSVEEARERQLSRQDNTTHTDTSENAKTRITEGLGPTGPAIAGMSHATLGVANVVTGGVEKLADFLVGFLSSGDDTPAKPPHEARIDKLLADRRASDALYHISESIARGDSLRPDDLKNLSREALNNILTKGNSYLIEMVRYADEERERERGRTRDQ